MRILTLRQPYAQLTVRGVRPFDARSWIANETSGRIAIHAAKHADTADELHAAAERDPHLLHYLADFHWHTKEALRELPRRAIVGTVTLKRVFLAKRLRQKPHLVGELTGDEWLWEFEDAVEIEPIPLEHGPMKLGTLNDATACAVVAAEQQARARGRKFKTSPIADSLEGWLAELRRRGGKWLVRDSLRDIAMTYSWCRHEVPPDLKSDEELEEEAEARGSAELRFNQSLETMLSIRFVNDADENKFQRRLHHYLAKLEKRKENGVTFVRADGAPAALTPIFVAHKWLTKEEFEGRLRWDIVRKTEVLCYNWWDDNTSAEELYDGSFVGARTVSERLTRGLHFLEHLCWLKAA